jgi:rRNA maturation RNase YbeY
MTDDFFPVFPEEAEEAEVVFQVEDVDFPDFDENLIANWIEQVILRHDATLGDLDYIFCSDDFLHRLNIEYLDHDTLTDIITFPYAEPPLVSGELYISTERVADNAQDAGVLFYDELCRVMIHGVLHLIGFGDKTPEDAAQMRTLEDEALAMRA